MARVEKIRGRLFTDRLILEEICIDHTPEVLLKGSFYDWSLGIFRNYQMVCWFDCFNDIVAASVDRDPELQEKVLEAVERLDGQADDSVIKFSIHAELQEGIYAIRQVDYNKELRRATDIEEPGELEGKELIPSKIDRWLRCGMIFNFIPKAKSFEPELSVIKFVKGFKQERITRVLHAMLLRYQYYLFLRKAECTHRESMRFVGLNDETFLMVKEVWRVA